jgi:hypothetical protein
MALRLSRVSLRRLVILNKGFNEADHLRQILGSDIRKVQGPTPIGWIR